MYYKILLYMIGVLWEIIEDLISYYRGRDFNKKHRRRHLNNMSEIQYTTWWSGSKNDIIVNTCGLLSGLGLSYISAVHENPIISGNLDCRIL